jgi:hypothetical protein
MTDELHRQAHPIFILKVDYPNLDHFRAVLCVWPLWKDERTLQTQVLSPILVDIRPRADLNEWHCRVIVDASHGEHWLGVSPGFSA